MKLVKRILFAAALMAFAVAGSSMQADAGKFDAAYYASKYPDVWEALGADQEALLNHYVTLGQREGRIPYSGAIQGEIVEEMLSSKPAETNAKGKFNPVFYATKYPDLAKAFGTDADKLYNHYTTKGQKEMRIPYPDAKAGEAVTGIASSEEMEKQTARKPITYLVKYVGDDWRFLPGTSTWIENGNHRELYYLKESILDGDVIIVDGSGGAPTVMKLEVSVELSNVTFTSGGKGNITAKGIDNVYVLQNSLGIINCDVTNAYVYDNGTAQFNNNVANLYISKDRSFDQTVAVGGTVDYMQTRDTQNVYKQLFAFRKGTFYMAGGTLKTNVSYYSEYRPLQ